MNFECPETSVSIARVTSDLSFIEQIGTVMTQTTDFYSFRHRDFDVTVLSDGPSTHGVHPSDSPMTSSVDGGADEIALAPSNIPLLVTLDDVILIDVGAGENKNENAGLLDANLARVGVTHSDVTLVVLNHAHSCQVWGLLRSDEMLRYESARYIMSAADWSFWMDDSNQPATDYKQLTRTITRQALSALLGRIALVEDGDEILPGMRVMVSSGHTPGHISLVLESDIPLIITGDAVASDIVSFEHPEWSFGFDVDAEQAGRTRRHLLGQADEEQARLLGFRWHYPGVGRAERSGSAFRLRRVSEAVR